MNILEVYMESKLQHSDTFIMLKRMAINYKNEGNYELALKFINQALVINKEDHGLLADKAEVLYKLKAYRQSFEIFKELLAFDKGRYSYLHGYYKCLYKLDGNIDIVDMDNLIYLKEEDELYYFEKNLLSNQKNNERFKKFLMDYFPEYALPDSVIHLSMKDAKKVINRAFEKPNKRKRMIALVYYQKELYKSLFSYLSREIKKSPYKWINYELYSEYKNLLKNTEDALKIVQKFEKQNPEKILLSAEKHITLLLESGRFESAKEIVIKNEKCISEKEAFNAEVKNHEYKKLSRLYEIIGDKHFIN